MKPRRSFLKTALLAPFAPLTLRALEVDAKEYLIRDLLGTLDGSVDSEARKILTKDLTSTHPFMSDAFDHSVGKDDGVYANTNVPPIIGLNMFGRRISDNPADVLNSLGREFQFRIIQFLFLEKDRYTIKKERVDISDYGWSQNQNTFHNSREGKPDIIGYDLVGNKPAIKTCFSKLVGCSDSGKYLEQHLDKVYHSVYWEDVIKDNDAHLFIYKD